MILTDWIEQVDDLKFRSWLLITRTQNLQIALHRLRPMLLSTVLLNLNKLVINGLQLVVIGSLISGARMSHPSISE